MVNDGANNEKQHFFDKPGNVRNFLRVFFVFCAVVIVLDLIDLVLHFFELAVATAISLFGLQSGAVLATVVGVLIEVPAMLSVVRLIGATRGWYERAPSVRKVAGPEIA